MPDDANQFIDDLQSNRTFTAMGRDAELEIIKRAQPPIDLRTVPIEQWGDYVGWDVVLPDPYPGKGPASETTVRKFEEAVERFHGVKPPFYISMSLTLQQTGRPWQFEEAAGQFLTGFTLGKE